MSKHKEKEKPENKAKPEVDAKVDAQSGASASAEEETAREAAQPIPEEQISELKDRLLRLQADFDNYRKRTNAEKLEMIKTAAEGVISSLLPVIDDMERALAAFKKAVPEAGPMPDGMVCEPMPYGAGGAAAQKALSDGVELIYNKLIGILRQRGVSECELMNQPFNEELAEAIAQIPAPTEEQKGMVLDVTQKGYKLGDKVIRYAKVVVGC